MAAGRNWQLKAKLRARAYGWRGSKLAISRLKEAVSEIRSVAKSDPVAAGDGVVSLMERIWPAFQDIDTSSGALGTAVARTVNDLIPILVDAPADHATGSKWLDRLFEAVQNDGVEYLGPVEGRWGEIARYPDLINKYADRLIGILRRAWADERRQNPPRARARPLASFGKGQNGIVTLMNDRRDKSCIQSRSCRGGDLAPCLHGRGSERPVRLC